MPDLDYAFIADYASVQGGKLTVVGASYAYVYTRSVPASHMVYVAGRVRTNAESGEVPLSIAIGPSDQGFVVRFEGMLRSDGPEEPYGDGKVGLLFAAAAPLQVSTFGLYEVNLTLDGQHVRRLAFEVRPLHPSS